MEGPQDLCTKFDKQALQPSHAPTSPNILTRRGGKYCGIDFLCAKSAEVQCFTSNLWNSRVKLAVKEPMKPMSGENDSAKGISLQSVK